MKRFGFFINLLLVGWLLMVGCGPSSSKKGDNGNGSSNSAPVLSYESPTIIVLGSVFNPLDGVTANDPEDGDVTDDIVIVSNNVNTAVIGSYTVTYSVTDSAGSTTTGDRVVEVIEEVVETDNFPVLSYDSPTAIVVGSVFDPLDGVTASDEEDGVITSSIEIVFNDLNTAVIGSYTITYSVTDSAGHTSTGDRIVTVVAAPVPPIPSEDDIDGTFLACSPSDTDDNVSNGVSDDANETIASEPFKQNVSSTYDDIDSRGLQTAHNTPEQLDMVMPATKADGNPSDDTHSYHPIVVSYLEHVPGSDYEMGDGSADIGDPDNLDMVKLALTRDNGQTWKNYVVSNSTEKDGGLEVVWNGQTINYPGDAQKPTMAVNGQYVMVAWNDKMCNGNPLGLLEVKDPDTNKTTYPTDVFAVNGPQGFMDYEGIVAPNGKTVYQVPFSCVWTARGIIDTDTAEITWHAPMQLTSGVRDSNHIRLAGSDAGFAISWHEDPKGLKAGEGAGPGEGWSGATGNRGTDIWYTSIKWDDFAATGAIDTDTSRPKSLNNFHYPVRVTDNEQCQDTDVKPYCAYFCGTYGTVTSPKGNESGDTVTRCLTYDTDMLTDTTSILDGDTGASRPAMSILKTNLDEYVIVLGYEETKALKVRVSGEGEQDQGEIPTDIAVEGKAVYFESFNFNAIDNFDENNISTIQNAAMPIVSAGNIINVKSPRSVDDPYSDGSGEMIFENARRLVIGTQIDSCDANETGALTFAILYKQSFEVQGASSDMFVRTWRGFTYDDAALLDGRVVTNVSSQEVTVGEGSAPEDYIVTWSEDNLGDNTYDNNRENTFSPRIFLRGENINIGFEYTPYEALEGEPVPVDGAWFPANFHTNLYSGVDGNWTGPVNITQVIDKKVNTVDARFFTTPKGSFDTTGLESDKSNPNVLFVTWGTLVDGEEADLFFKRSTDNGQTWEDEQNLSSIQGSTVQEKEVESFASPDGKHIYNVWLQQTETLNNVDPAVYEGLDTWFGRVDYNSTVIPAP
jgi:hypothetical protein